MRQDEELGVKNEAARITEANVSVERRDILITKVGAA